MADGEVHAHRRAERDARDMGLLDPDGAEEGGDLVGIDLSRVRPGGFVALARARKVQRDAAEVRGVGRQLERIASMIGGQLRDQQQRFAFSLHVVVDRDSVYVDLRHARSLLTTDGTAHSLANGRQAASVGAAPSRPKLLSFCHYPSGSQDLVLLAEGVNDAARHGRDVWAEPVP
jgi:hypothetical protein